MTDQLNLQTRERLTIENRCASPVRLHIEPWGEQLLLPMNRVHEVVAQGPPRGGLHIEIAPECITVHGWVASTLSIFSEGAVVLECSTPVPKAPPGLRP